MVKFCPFVMEKLVLGNQKIFKINKKKRNYEKYCISNRRL